MTIRIRSVCFRSTRKNWVTADGGQGVHRTRSRLYENWCQTNANSLMCCLSLGPASTRCAVCQQQFANYMLITADDARRCSTICEGACLATSSNSIPSIFKHLLKVLKRWYSALHSLRIKRTSYCPTSAVSIYRSATSLNHKTNREKHTWANKICRFHFQFRPISCFWDTCVMRNHCHT